MAAAPMCIRANPGCSADVHPGESWLQPPQTPARLLYPQQETIFIRGARIRYPVFGGLELLACYRLPARLDAATSERVHAHTDALHALVMQPSQQADPLPDLCTVLELGMRLFRALTAEAQLHADALARLQGAERLAPVLEFIREHLHEPLDRARLAAVLGLSEYRTHELFKAILGQAPMAYVRYCRIEEARRLLIDSDLSLATIAERLCFTDVFHFSRSFKKHSGQSPSNFRRAQC